MESKRNNRLITKVLIIGAVIAVLSYLFHPEAGQLSIVINGQPIAEPLVRFAAVPTFVMIMGLAITFVVLLFLGIGVFMFLGLLFIAFAVCVIMVPYFWPVLC